MRWPRLWENKVRYIAFGYDERNYIRYTKNPGVGFGWGRMRVAISVRRGIEYFERGRRQQWVRVKCWLSPMHCVDPAQRRMI